jgi:hypothetical protein
MRIANSTYGTIFYQDTANFHILVTNSGDPLGGWNGLRPFYFNLANGNVNMSHAVSIGNGLTVTGNVNISGQYQVNGVPLSTGSQTPWASDIDAANHSLSNVNLISGPASRNNATYISCPGAAVGTIPEGYMSFSTNGSQVYIYVKTGGIQKVAIINIS